MKIGIVGIGIVGGACKFGFELLGHKVTVHDIKLDTKLDDILPTDAVFIHLRPNSFKCRRLL